MKVTKKGCKNKHEINTGISQKKLKSKRRECGRNRYKKYVWRKLTKTKKQMGKAIKTQEKYGFIKFIFVAYSIKDE